ncbi:Histone-lysine N-methyltransferase 2E [Toxocara canis]|uniref:Histone-lysine N-methyltransferase 2E n=1 Tax=Toxocara canis TaxID=6265 RepID=A0A0B2W5N2_TOXCA|nr:Histone-lysine N-methyltransferase 2E [Toxocara canis]
MRKSGSVARYARHSCHPNVKLQHFFSNGKIHIVAIATEKVERGDEITFPFDNDYAQSTEKLVCACCAQLEEDEALYHAPTSDDAYVCPIKVLNHELAQLEQQPIPPQPEMPKRVLNKATPAKNNGKKRCAKKVGVSVAKMLHKKAIQRVRKAKGMQKTDGRGRPRTSPIKAIASLAGRGKTVVKTGADDSGAGDVASGCQNKVNMKSEVPEARFHQLQQSSSVASTDEEGAASRKSTTMTAESISRKAVGKSHKKSKSKAAPKNATSAMSVTAQRKRKGAIKLKRRARKPSTKSADEKVGEKGATQEQSAAGVEKADNALVKE